MTPLEARKEREKTSPSPNQIIHGRLETVAAAISALAALTPPDKPRPDVAHELPARSDVRLSSATNVSALASDAEIADLRIERGHFTCRFGDIPIDGAIAEDGAITEIRFDGRTVILSHPVSVQTLERFLRHATATSALLHARGIAPRNGTMEALGGARFLFTTGADGRAQPAIATTRNVFTMDPAEESERSGAEMRWKDALRSLAALAQAQHDAINARIEVHNGRMRAVYDDLTRRMESDNWYYWQQRRNEFAQGWNAVVAPWKQAGTDARGALLPRFHAHLDAWERWIAIQPDMEAEDVFLNRYDATVRELAEHRDQEQTLRAGAHTRHLRDAVHGFTIIEQSSHLSPKNFTREERNGSGLLFRRQTYEDDVLTQETEYDPSGNVTQETLSQYFPGGQVRRVQEQAPKDGKLVLQRQTDFWRNGNTHAVLDQRSDAFAYFGEGGSLLYEDVARGNPAKRQRGMVDAKGERFGLYRDEKAKNPTLTTGQYLDMLAQKLDTEEKLAVFFEQFLRYAYDVGDEWQTAEETLQRTEELEKTGAYYMRGDCDDYAFLARDILRRQGKNAHVVFIPQHAICVWVERDAEGEFHAKAQDTFGFDHNGNRYGRDHPRDRESAKGFTKLIDALNSLMKKYKYPGLGVPSGQDYTLHENAITIMPNPPAGNFQLVTAEHFLSHPSP
ncbi:hypothetical protein A2789_01125 [Candidatus Peribacteria bacterium RIFCSPHIGHO2_01_FULL_54_22]|nr:MAG: hypothetical protein A2789_01125 [Candidatus Peribacteria bacterium RIFCSPHIGHO2_01_FULL_54_22]